MRRFETPPLDIILLARIKKGIAMRAKCSSPLYNFWATAIRGRASWYQNVVITERPRQIARGIPRTRYTKKTTKRVIPKLSIRFLL
jgi:hypothetical protein